MAEQEDNEKGNIFGPLEEGVQKNGNNGRTPVNPAAQNPRKFRVETFEGRSSERSEKPTEA
jgi:hypothetical protein